MSQALEFDLPIEISDGVTTINLKIGMKDGATDGRDRGIDRLAPPPPPAEFLGAHVNGAAGDLWWDYRAPSADTVRYVITINASEINGAPVISWDETIDLAALGSFRIKNRLAPPIQEIFDVDMTALDSLDTAGPPDLSRGVIIEVVLNEPGIQTLVAVEDSYVRGSNAYDDINYNGQDSLHVQNGTTTANRYHSYIKFDLNEVTGDSVVSAVVKLYPYSVVGSGQTHQASLSNSDTWTDSTITWTNRPAVGSVFASWEPKQDTVVTIDVTSQAQAAWLDDKVFSLRISSGTSSETLWAVYGNEEHPTAAYRPVIEITMDGGATNVPPAVSLTAPTESATFTEGDPIAIAASASDSDGSVTKVEFYAGSTLLGEDTTSPYEYTWTTAAAGSHALTAVATDNALATTTSSAVTITVEEAGGLQALVAVEDSYVRGSNAYDDINYNGQDSLHVQNGTSTANRYHSYIKFDLGSVTGDSVVSAVVKLYPYSVVGAGQTHQAALSNLDTWADSTITWTNRPAAGSVFASWTPVQGTVTTIDVTSQAQAAWLDDKVFSLRISSGTSSETQWAVYGNEEHPTAAYRPVIEITTVSGGGAKAETSTLAESAAELPDQFTIVGNYPNPFNAVTTVLIDLPDEAQVRLEILDMTGRVVLIIPDIGVPPGRGRSLTVDASQLASGTYLCRAYARMASYTAVATGRMTLIK